MATAPATTLRGSIGANLVPLDELDLEAGEFKNPRTLTGLAPTEIRTLAESVWRDGLFDPLKIKRYTVGEPPVKRKLVVDGQRRTLALRYLVEAGFLAPNVMVPVVIVDPEDNAPVMDPATSIEAFVAALIAGSQRAPLSSYEQVDAAATLLAGKKKQSEIALILGRSDAWVSRMLAAWKTSTHELRQTFKLGSITDEQFKELATVKAAEQPKVVADIADTRERGERKEARDKSKAAAAVNTPEPKKRAATVLREAASAREPQRNVLADYRPPPKEIPPRAALGKRDVTSGEILAMVAVIAPEDQYMRGIVDMCRVIQGELDTSKLGKPFKVWLERVKKKMASKEVKPSLAVLAKGKKLPRVKPAAIAKPHGGATSKACSARHHVRCQQMIKDGKTGSCGCACHKGT